MKLPDHYSVRPDNITDRRLLVSGSEGVLG